MLCWLCCMGLFLRGIRGYLYYPWGKWKQSLFGSNTLPLKGSFKVLTELKNVDYNRDIEYPNSNNISNQIICNVEMTGANMRAIGFDMDYTLAQYNKEFEVLCFEEAKKKLLEQMKYPSYLLDIEYNQDHYQRGLIIDKYRGNLLKINRHKLVKIAYHGRQKLTAQEIRDTYTISAPTFTESYYQNIDTFFLLGDAVLYQHFIELKRSEDPFLSKKTFEQIYNDVRKAVDISHRDGAIKQAVMQDPAKYIVPDPAIVPMLRHLRQQGKKVFLLTNSLYDYTCAIMSYIMKDKGDWHDLFDVIIVNAGKPSFWKEERPLFTVHIDGRMHNIEHKITVNSINLTNHKIFQGGYWQHLNQILNISHGDSIMYVGDHMYADILRSKRTVGWRTCLIVPELEHEINTEIQQAELSANITAKSNELHQLEDYIEDLQLTKAKPELILKAKEYARLLEEELEDMKDWYHKQFNVYWGKLFKAGDQHSRFGKQLQDYACLYTSKASNLLYVSVNRSFRPVQDFMGTSLFDFESGSGIQ